MPDKSINFQKLKIGLLGGSFNPPHQAHLEISRKAIEVLKLDYVWWLVTPGNPLKDPRVYASYGDRLAASRILTQNTNIMVSDFEHRYQLSFTIDTLRALKTRFSSFDIVWLMGEDSLESFHQWKDWEAIAHEMPFAVFNRPETGDAEHSSPAAKSFAGNKIPLSDAHNLAGSKAPAWVFVPDTNFSHSSTAIRDSNINWQKEMLAKTTHSQKP